MKTPSLDDLTPAAYNPRGITDRNFEALGYSLAEFGDISGIVWNQRTGNLVTGHQRLRSLQETHGDALKMQRGVICTPDSETFRVRVVDWPKQKEKAANIAANSPLLAGHFTEDLVELVGEVDAALPDLSGELLLNELLSSLGMAPDVDVVEDEVPDLPKKATTRPGDLWALGEHRVLCADSTRPDAVSSLFGTRMADFIFTSPPYNVGVEYGEHDDTTTDWSGYAPFLEAAVSAWIPFLQEGRLIGWNIGVSPKTHHARQMVMFEDHGLSFVRQMVWKKVGVPLPSWFHTTSDMRARRFTPNFVHELVLLFSKGPVQVGDPVRGDSLCQHDLFEINQTAATIDLPSGSARTGTQPNLGRANKAHPAAYPVRLPAMFIAHLCDRMAITADLFLGSGTSLIACEQLERICFGNELEPRYCDVIVERWQNLTGRKARRKKGVVP